MLFDDSRCRENLAHKDMVRTATKMKTRCRSDDGTLDNLSCFLLRLCPLSTFNQQTSLSPHSAEESRDRKKKKTTKTINPSVIVIRRFERSIRMKTTFHSLSAVSHSPLPL
jgi:hypothetical protein